MKTITLTGDGLEQLATLQAELGGKDITRVRQPGEQQYFIRTSDLLQALIEQGVFNTHLAGLCMPMQENGMRVFDYGAESFCVGVLYFIPKAPPEPAVNTRPVPGVQ